MLKKKHAFFGLLKEASFSGFFVQKRDRSKKIKIGVTSTYSFPYMIY